MRLVPTPRPSVDAVKAGPWTPVEDISEQPRFRMFADHYGRAEYALAASATFNDTKVLAFQMSFRKRNDEYRGWSTSFRLRTCVLAELRDATPSLLISNRAIQDVQTTVFEGMRRVRSTPRRFRGMFSARSHNRDFAREVLNDATCSLFLAEPGFSCLESVYDLALFVFDGDASRDHAVAFALSFVDQLRAVTTGTGSARVRVLDA